MDHAGPSVLLQQLSLTTLLRLELSIAYQSNSKLIVLRHTETKAAMEAIMMMPLDTSMILALSKRLTILILILIQLASMSSLK